MKALGLRRSLPEGIAHALGERILAGGYGPGAPIREEEIAQQFNASRNTVREALLLLEQERLVQRRTHRGCRVSQPDVDDVDAIMNLRMIVEPGAVRVLCRRGGDLSAPARIAARLQRAARKDDWVEYGALDLDFHSALVAAAGSELLHDGFQRAIRPLQLVFLKVDLQPEPDREHIEEHALLLDTVKERDEAAALALIDKHLTAAHRALARSLERR